jgi:hypothetical protein
MWARTWSQHSHRNGDCKWKLQQARVSLAWEGVFLAPMGWTLTFHNADQRHGENPQAPLSRAPNDSLIHELRWFLQIIKEVHFIFVCMYAYMYACPYLFNSIQRTFLKRTGEWAICPRLDVSRHAGLFQGTRASCRRGFLRSSLDPLSVKEASHRKHSPLLIQICSHGLRPFVSLSCIPLLCPDKGHRRIPPPWLKML